MAAALPTCCVRHASCAAGRGDWAVPIVGRFSYGTNHVCVHYADPHAGAVVRFGAFCSVATGVTVWCGGNHRTDWVTTYPFGHREHAAFPTATGIVGHPATRGGVTVGNDVWIGADATLMSGVTVGDGAVIANSAHVVRDVPPYAVVGGNPARVIRIRFAPDVVDALLALRWWDRPTPWIDAHARSLLCAAPDVAAIRRAAAAAPSQS